MHLDEIIQGDCLDVLPTLAEKSIDVIFADPPYNLQLSQELWRPNMTRVNGVDDAWDKFGSFREYDEFTRAWLAACRRVLKDTGTLWVIGSYHNIFRVGTILMDLDYWILNDVIWVKTNPMPNFKGVRFTNAHETLIWAQKNKGEHYTFNHHAMKGLNDGLQMRSDWEIPLCTGRERVKVNGQKAHATQKPEALLYRVILSSTNAGDVILDPFMGSGTTGAVAKRLHRHWLGIEKDPAYVEMARARIMEVDAGEYEEELYATTSPKRLERVPFGALLAQGLLKTGQLLYFGRKGEHVAVILADGNLLFDDRRGSIHKVGSEISGAPCNGWQAWFYEDEADGTRLPLDTLRKKYIESCGREG
jgi:site-specific DNA-methyltransferase (adenine-specific)